MRSRFLVATTDFPLAAGVFALTGVRSGDGVVMITFDPANGGCPVPAPAAAAPAPVASMPRFTG